MKDYAKAGNRKGKPAYRTPSRFIQKKTAQNKKTAAFWEPQRLASRLEYRQPKERQK